MPISFAPSAMSLRGQSLGDLGTDETLEAREITAHLRAYIPEDQVAQTEIGIGWREKQISQGRAVLIRNKTALYVDIMLGTSAAIFLAMLVVVVVFVTFLIVAKVRFKRQVRVIKAWLSQRWDEMKLFMQNQKSEQGGLPPDLQTLAQETKASFRR